MIAIQNSAYETTIKPAVKQVETALRTARSVLRDPKKFVARKTLAAVLVDGEGSEKIASLYDDPIALFHKLTELYGREWYDWEAETLWLAARSALWSATMPSRCSDRRQP